MSELTLYKNYSYYSTGRIVRYIREKIKNFLYWVIDVNEIGQRKQLNEFGQLKGINFYGYDKDIYKSDLYEQILNIKETIKKLENNKDKESKQDINCDVFAFIQNCELYDDRTIAGTYSTINKICLRKIFDKKLKLISIKHAKTVSEIHDLSLFISLKFPNETLYDNINRTNHLISMSRAKGVTIEETKKELYV